MYFNIVIEGHGGPESDDFATMVTTMVPPRRRARRLAVLLAATAAALPRTCEVSIGEDYLLGEPAALKCGLPVSRSYLLSKYGLALVAEAPASPEAGRPLTVTVKGCDVKERRGSPRSRRDSRSRRTSGRPRCPTWSSRGPSSSTS